MRTAHGQQNKLYASVGALHVDRFEKWALREGGGIGRLLAVILPPHLCVRVCTA